MNKKIVLITSSFPFGKSEVWAISEINSIVELGNEILIIPRSGKGQITNQDAIKFSSNLIDLPLLDWKILIYFLKSLSIKPFLILKLFIANFEQSNSIIDFLKGVAVLPKSIFLSKLLKQSNIDHIHSLQTTSIAFMAFIISSIIEVPWSCTLHTSEIVNSNYRRSFKFRLNSASALRTISRKTWKDLSNFLGPDSSKKILMIPLGVNVNDFKKKTNLNKNFFVIVTPAELTNRKGHAYAIEAAKKMLDKGITNFKWFFYGSGPLKDELIKKVKDLNLINHCFFPGNLDHDLLMKKYREDEVDIVVISSISKNVPEGIPVSLMEAMSFEIPVIATDSGSTRELVDGTSGILVNQNDSEALSSAIVKFINKPKYMKEIGKNGRNKVSQDFDAMKNANDLVKIF